MLFTTANIAIVVSISGCSTWTPYNICLENQFIFLWVQPLFERCCKLPSIQFDKMFELDKPEYSRLCTDFEWLRSIELDYTD